MLNVACCLWDANANSQSFSLCYDESWVEKLYRGFSRNLTGPFKFVVFTDRLRQFSEGNISQERLATIRPHYGCLIEPFKISEPTIICGLDTVIVRNLDHFAAYCLQEDRPAAVGHPSNKPKFGFINPVVLKPSGWTHLYDEWRGENDMDYLKRRDFNDIGEMYPGQLLSLKLNKVTHGANLPPDARIIYFHGRSKPHELQHVDWIKQHWV